MRLLPLCLIFILMISCGSKKTSLWVPARQRQKTRQSRLAEYTLRWVCARFTKLRAVKLAISDAIPSRGSIEANVLHRENYDVSSLQRYRLRR